MDQSRVSPPSTPVFLPKLAVALALCVLLLAGGEVFSYFVLRAWSPHRDKSNPPAFIARNNPQARELWKEWESSSENLQYKAYVVWRRDKYDGQTVHINSAGLRNTAYSDCTPGAFKIWMFGNSTLWGMGSLDDQTIPSQLAKRFQDAGHRVCVKNYGEYGWVNTQELIELELELKAEAQKPNLVIFYDGVSDSFLPYETDAGDVHGNYNQMRVFFKDFRKEQKPGFDFLRSTNTYRLLDELSNKFARSTVQAAVAPAESRPVDELVQQIQSNYEKNMELAELLGQKFGFRCVFFWQPSALVGPKPFTREEEELRAMSEKSNPGIQQLFKATWAAMRDVHDPDYEFLGDIFRDHAERVYVDVSHIGPDANRLVVDAMYRAAQSGSVAYTAGHAPQRSEVKTR
jgi:hypothetical protein